MIDLILWAPDKTTFGTFAQANNLLDQDGVPREGLAYDWWRGNGKLITALPVVDANGDVTTPGTTLAGFVLLLRIYGSFFASDQIAGGSEQWQRSKVAKYVKNNGTPGTIAGMTYYELDGVRLFRYDDVQAWLTTNNLPGHEWQGGNRS